MSGVEITDVTPGCFLTNVRKVASVEIQVAVTDYLTNSFLPN